MFVYNHLVVFEMDLILEYVMMLSLSAEKRKQEVSEIQAGLDDADVLVTLFFGRDSSQNFADLQILNEYSNFITRFGKWTLRLGVCSRV